MAQEQYFIGCINMEFADFWKRRLSKIYHTDTHSPDASNEIMQEINRQYDEFKLDYEKTHPDKNNPKTKRSPPRPAIEKVNNLQVLLDIAKEVGRIEKQNGDIVLTVDMVKMRTSMKTVFNNETILEMTLAGIMSTIPEKK